MKRLNVFLLFFVLFAAKSYAQNPVNWTPEQLMEPTQLAQRLKAGKDVPVLVSVGPGAMIPNSIDVGSVKEKEHFDKLTATLRDLKRDTAVVVYCGCCPFEHCPNVRPAMALLRDMHFTNYKLLNLPHNLKTDWLDKGYPAAKF